MSQFKETNDIEKSYQSKIRLLEENVEKLKTENKRFVEEAANYLKIIEDSSKGYSPTQNNEHNNQLQQGIYNGSINNITKTSGTHIRKS